MTWRAVWAAMRPKFVRRDVELVADGRALDLVELLGEHPDVEGAGVDRDPGVLVGVGHPLVGGLEGVGQRRHQGVDGDALLGGERLEGVEHVGIAHDRAFLLDFWPDFGPDF